MRARPISLENWSQTQREACARRLLFLARRLNRGEIATESARPEEALEALVRELSRSELPIEGQIGFLFLGLLARYPAVEEIADLAFEARMRGLSGVIERIGGFREWRAIGGGKTVHDLLAFDEETLLIDVSHTAHYPYTSGIQRVVRNLARALENAERKHVFFVCDPNSMRPRAATGEEVKKLFGPEASALSFEPALRAACSEKPAQGRARARFWARRIAKALFGIPYGAIKVPLEILLGGTFRGERFLSWMREKKDRLKKRALGTEKVGASRASSAYPERQNVLCFFGARVLLPEVSAESDRVAMYLGAKNAFSFDFTMILFDLIPVVYPEFCVGGLKAGFLDYLKLFRIADRVSCISGATANEARALAALIPRPNGAPRFVAHPLPGEIRTFFAPAAQAPGPPIVLVVGTIEPRKNGIGILRAARLLAKEGLFFRLVFAGHRGWLSENFDRELSRCRKEGLDVELRISISDGALAELYARCRFSVFCSFAEGFGLPALESLYFHKPVIVSDKGSLREIASLGGCLLVDPERIETIAGAMRKLLCDEDLYSRLQQETFRIRPRTWEEYADEVYRFALGERLRAASSSTNR
jgi:glycosyltransferase involved in cell wall biosynthesis